MAYDHSGDLPESYRFTAIANQLVEPNLRAILHERAESSNFLNEIGHPAVVSAISRMGGSSEAAFADFGTTLYEIATDTPNVGNDLITTPTYRNPVEQQAAFWTSYTMDCFDPLDVCRAADMSLKIMIEDAPMLDEFIDDISSIAFSDGLTHREKIMVKTGAALMRSLHITGQYRLDGGVFENQ